jgi:hypothetical protein
MVKLKPHQSFQKVFSARDDQDFVPGAMPNRSSLAARN